MNRIKYITLGICLFMGFSTNLSAQTKAQYRVKLNRENPKQLEVYDTLVSLTYLSEKLNESENNMQLLESFDYPKLNITTAGNQTILSNDSVKIILTTAAFDSVRFKANYQHDSSLYYTNLYFRDLQMEFDYPPYYPEFEVSDLKLVIHNKEVNLPVSAYRDLFNPFLKSPHTVNELEIFGLNGYMADNGNILLTLLCGEGTGAFKVIFLFDSNGNLLYRINEPVI